MGYVAKTISYLKRNGFAPTVSAVMERIDKTGMDLDQKIANEYRKRPDSVCEDVMTDGRICFSILVPAYETDEGFLKILMDSVLGQTYQNLQLVIADASKSDKVQNVIEQYQDERITYKKLTENKGISYNTNQALELATGDYIGLLDHDDVLEKDALYHIYQKISENECDMVYTDEDKMSFDDLTFFEPNFKPDFNPDYLLTNNYICHFTVLKSALMKKLKFREAYDGAQDYDLFLRAAFEIDREYSDSHDPIFKNRKLLQKKIGHVNKVLYHWRAHSGSTADNPESKRYAYEAGRRALSDFVKCAGWDANVSDCRHLGFYEIGYNQSIWSVRKDIAAVCTADIRNGKVIKGIELDGKTRFENMRSCYSGYLHRFSLTMDIDKVTTSQYKVRDGIKLEKDGSTREGNIVYLPVSQYQKLREKGN